MEPFKPDWYQRLNNGPFQQKTFTARSMLSVEERLKKSPFRKTSLIGFSSTIIIVTVILILCSPHWKSIIEQINVTKLTEQASFSEQIAAELVQIEDISGSNWKGKMMLVSDPKSIRVVVTSKQDSGERITDMVKRTGAIAGVNGGHYVNLDGSGSGFVPLGLVVSDTLPLFVDKELKKQHVIGFTNTGTMVIGSYTMEELINMHIKEAVSSIPQIIANGKALISDKNDDSDINPRTAVGQKADGTVIFIVIDGKQQNSLGATLKDVQELFINQGAVTAGLLNGGAASEMVLGSRLVTNPAEQIGEQNLPTGFLVFEHPENVAVGNPWNLNPNP